MKIRVCPSCGKHNQLDSWSCIKCDATLPMDSVVDMDKALVQLNDTPAEASSPEVESDLMTTEIPADWGATVAERVATELAVEAAAEEEERLRRSLVKGFCDYDLPMSLGHQAKIYGSFRHAGELGLEILFDFLRSDHVGVRTTALRILTDMEGLTYRSPHEVVEVVAEAMEDAEPDVRKGVLSYFYKRIQGPGTPAATRMRVVEICVRGLKDEQTALRLQAEGVVDTWVKYWTDLDLTDLVDALIQALVDKDSRVRRKAAAALGKTGDQRAVEPLRLAMSDEKRAVRKGAEKALKAMGVSVE